jgi:hypothetical protein
MNSDPRDALRAVALPAGAPLECSDEYTPLDEGSHCPTELLGSFTLLMAGHGRCVSADMMLGDREYAMWQLARAHTVADQRLREVAATLFEYFAHSRGAAVPTRA